MITREARSAFFRDSIMPLPLALPHTNGSFIGVFQGLG
jgi:hypothetical protein